MKLIDKDALLAEIRELREHEIRWMERQGFTHYRMGERDAYTRILELLDTLEVKEVDLEKEINKYFSDNFFGSETMGFFAARTNEEPNYVDIALCAKHFFELGLKAQKGEDV